MQTRIVRGRPYVSHMSIVLLLILVWLVWRIAADHGRRQAQRALEGSLPQELPRGVRGQRGIVMCEHEGWAYWRHDDDLMRAPLVAGRAELRYAHAVDVLACEELSPADAMTILDALDAAETRFGSA